VLRFDRCSKLIEVGGILNADFETNLVASSFDSALRRLDCLFNLFDFRNRVAILRIKRAFGQQIMP
jgi:hypothetical protein